MGKQEHAALGANKPRCGGPFVLFGFSYQKDYAAFAFA